MLIPAAQQSDRTPCGRYSLLPFTEEQIGRVFDDNFAYFFIKTYAVGAH